MPGRIFFRDECGRVTSTELVVGESLYPMAEILSARGSRHRSFLHFLGFQQYRLLITTASGEHEVLRHRNAYLVFQLAKAIETALRETGRGASPGRSSTRPEAPGANDLAGSLAT